MPARLLTVLALLLLLWGDVLQAQVIPSPPAAGGSSAALQASDYGVVCDGTTDTTAALQAALDAARIGTQGLTLAMPRATGTCRLTSTITIANVTGLELQGNGVKFIWDGASTTTPMFLFQDTNRAFFHNFQVAASTAKPVATIFQFENATGGTVTPSSNLLQDVIVECTNGGCTNAIRMAQGTGGDANNEFNTFERVRVSNPANACAKIDHSQSKTNVFVDFECANNGIGVHIIENTHGSFHCVRCRGGGSTGADFYITNSNDLITITQSNFENSNRLLETPNSSGADLPLHISDTRWSVTNFLNADNRPIVYLFRGPFVLETTKFEPATANKALQIRWNPGSNFGSFTARNNYISSTLANPFFGTMPTWQEGNLINRNDGSNAVQLGASFSPIPIPSQTINSGTTITADACGSVKSLTATGAVTTNTTNTFDAPAVFNTGCAMRVCNVGANAITLDANTNFLTSDGNDVVLAALTASAVSCVTVVQSGTKWYQVR